MTLVVVVAGWIVVGTATLVAFALGASLGYQRGYREGLDAGQRSGRADGIREGLRGGDGLRVEHVLPDPAERSEG